MKVFSTESVCLKAALVFFYVLCIINVDSKANAAKINLKKKDLMNTLFPGSVNGGITIGHDNDHKHHHHDHDNKENSHSSEGNSHSSEGNSHSSDDNSHSSEENSHSSEEHDGHHHHHHDHDHHQVHFDFAIPSSVTMVFHQFTLLSKMLTPFLHSLQSNNLVTDKASVETIINAFNHISELFSEVNFKTPMELKVALGKANDYINDITVNANKLAGSLDLMGKTTLNTIIKQLGGLTESIGKIDFNQIGKIGETGSKDITLHITFGFPLSSSMNTSFSYLMEAIAKFYPYLQELQSSGTANKDDVNKLVTTFDKIINLLKDATFKTPEDLKVAIEKLTGDFKIVLSLADKLKRDGVSGIDSYITLFNNLDKCFQTSDIDLNGDITVPKIRLNFQASPQLTGTVNLIQTYLDQITLAFQGLLKLPNIKDKSKLESIQKSIRLIIKLLTETAFETEEQLKKALSSAASQITEVASEIGSFFNTIEGEAKNVVGNILGYFSHIGEEFGDLKIPGIVIKGPKGVLSPHIQFGFDASPQITAAVNSINTFFDGISLSLNMFLKNPLIRDKSHIEFINKNFKQILAILGGIKFKTEQELKEAFSRAIVVINNMIQDIRMLLRSGVKGMEKTLLQSILTVFSNLIKPLSKLSIPGIGIVLEENGNTDEGSRTTPEGIRTTQRGGGHTQGWIRTTQRDTGSSSGRTTPRSFRTTSERSRVTSSTSGSVATDGNTIRIDQGFQTSPQTSIGVNLINSLLNHITFTIENLSKNPNIPDNTDFEEFKEDINNIILKLHSTKFNSEGDLKTALTNVLPKINGFIDEIDNKLTTGNVDDNEKGVLQTLLSILLNFKSPFGLVGVNGINSNVNNCPCAVNHK